jgi:hypothetical protein
MHFIILRIRRDREQWERSLILFRQLDTDDSVRQPMQSAELLFLKLTVLDQRKGPGTITQERFEMAFLYSAIGSVCAGPTPEGHSDEYKPYCEEFSLDLVHLPIIQTGAPSCWWMSLSFRALASPAVSF